MDASLRTRAEELAGEMASQAKTAEDLNGLMPLMMKAAMERIARHRDGCPPGP